MQEVLNFYIYEIKKGTKPMALMSVAKEDTRKCLDKITKNELFSYVSEIDGKNNIFFGKKECVEIVSTFPKELSKLSPQQDFILGTMLGYNRIEQCRRYLNKLNYTPSGNF